MGPQCVGHHLISPVLGPVFSEVMAPVKCTVNVLKFGTLYSLLFWPKFAFYAAIS